MKQVTKMPENKFGMVFLEVVMAITIVGIVLVASVALIARSLSASTSARDRAMATSLAEETQEWLRSQRDSSWQSFYSRANGVWCLRSLSWTSGGTRAGACTETDTASGTVNMIREVTFTRSGFANQTVTATVVVRFSDSLGQHQSESTAIYTNWRGNR